MASSHHPTSPIFSSCDAACVMLCCSVLPSSSSTPLRPSVYNASISLLVNIISIRTVCDNLDVLYISTRQACIVLKSGWSSTARMRRLIVSPPALSRHPTTTPPSRWLAPTTLPPLAKFQLVWRRLCEALLSSSLVRNTRFCCLV